MSWICPKCETENPDRLKVCEVCDSPREASSKDKLKEKYSEAAYRSFIRHHHDLLESADNGDKNAQYQVGEWFYKRVGKNSSAEYSNIAVFWFRKAAILGHVESQLKLAACYEKGIGVPLRKSEAMKWYKKASDKGNYDAKFQYVRLKYRDKTYKGVVRYRLALLVSADSGDVNSQFQLGEWFNNHDSQLVYSSEAAMWYRRAANKGHIGAMVKLGFYYEHQLASLDDAAKMYKKAAERGDGEGQYHLGRCYEYGYGVSKNTEKAKHWYLEASQNGNIEARTCLNRLEYRVPNEPKNVEVERKTKIPMHEIVFLFAIVTFLFVVIGGTIVAAVIAALRDYGNITISDEMNSTLIAVGCVLGGVVGIFILLNDSND